jgi:hypothetical protein
LYEVIHSNTANRAASLVTKRASSTSPRFNDDQRLSAIAGLTALFAGDVVAPESVWPGWPERMEKRRAKRRRRAELEARRHEAAVRRVWGDRADERLGETGGAG